MEPENSLARVNRDGSITCWVNSQKPFDDQKTIAEVLGIPITQVQVIGALVGGAFGGKEDSGICVLTALAAWSIQGSVQICNARKDSFTAHPKRHPARIHIKMAADKTGKLQALEINSSSRYRCLRVLWTCGGQPLHRDGSRTVLLPCHPHPHPGDVHP